MLTQKLNSSHLKKSKNKPVNKPDLAGLTDIHKEAIFNHEDCRKVFNERIKEVKLGVSKHTALLIVIFETLLPEISDKQLNLSEVEGEYEQLIDLMNSEYDGGEYPAHPGIFIRMAKLIEQAPGKLYADTNKERLKVVIACREVLKAVKDLEIPIRDTCIAEFYENATQDQLDDIRMVVKHRDNPQGYGMPGNGGVPQFRM